MANAPATFMLALRPAIGMVTFLVPFDAIERAFPTLDGDPFLAAARGAFNGHVIGIAN